MIFNPSSEGIAVKTEHFKALDLATKAGGTNLKDKDLGGKAIVAELIEAGYLERAGKPKVLGLTEKGKQAFEHESHPERVELREKARQRVVLVDFLKVIEEKGKLSGGDKKKFPESIVEDAKAKRLIVPGKKADTYEIQLAGATILFGEKPLDQQMAVLKKSNEELQARVRNAQEKAKHELDAVHGPGAAELKSALAHIEASGKEAAEKFTRVLDEIAAFSSVAAAAQSYQKTLDEAQHAALQKLQAEKEESSHQVSHLKQAISAELRKIEEELKHLGERIAATESKAGELLKAPKPTPPAAPAHHETHDHAHPKKEGHPATSDAQLWTATKEEFTKLHEETQRMGGIVKIPELTDAVRKHITDLKTNHFHDLLKQWSEAGKLTLQLCSMTDREPRANEGIQTATGLLFYVSMPHG